MKKDNMNKTNNKGNKTNPEKVDKEQKKLFWLISISAILLISGGVFAYVSSEKYHAEKYETAINENSELTEELAFRDSLVNEWIETFNEIEKDLITMQEKENLLKINSSDPELTKDIRERVKAEIRHFNTLLKENKAKIETLNRKLKESGFQIAALKKKVIRLEEAVEERDRTLADLKFELIEKDFEFAELNMLVDSLDYEILKKEEELLKKEEELLKHRAQLNRAYIAYGTKGELKEKGLWKKEGGFLGLIGRNKTVPTKLSETEFQKIDISQTNKIAIQAKKAEFISDHPKESYEIVKNDSLISHVKIEDPNAFWKITRYAVIETK